MNDGNTIDLILASSSPRRRELLAQAGFSFRVVVPPLDEPDQMGADVPPEARAEALSYFKARSVAKSLPEAESRGAVILAADTIVALAGRIYGKADDVDEARAILRSLSGTKHRVVTGVALLDAGLIRRVIKHDVTWVHMKTMAPEAMEQYLQSKAWEGKAGAYGIQDRGDAFIERIEGSFTNVVGLPMELVRQMLNAWGISPQKTGPLPTETA